MKKSKAPYLQTSLVWYAIKMTMRQDSKKQPKKLNKKSNNIKFMKTRGVNTEKQIFK